MRFLSGIIMVNRACILENEWGGRDNVWKVFICNGYCSNIICYWTQRTKEYTYSWRRRFNKM